MIFVLYPDRPEMADDVLRRGRLEAMAPRLAAAGANEIVSVGDDARWRDQPQLYRDGIHPSPAGMAMFASIIADQLERHAPR